MSLAICAAPAARHLAHPVELLAHVVRLAAETGAIFARHSCGRGGRTGRGLAALAQPYPWRVAVHKLNPHPLKGLAHFADRLGAAGLQVRRRMLCELAPTPVGL